MDLECCYKLFWDRRVAPGALVTIVSGVGGCDLRFGICTLYNQSNNYKSFVEEIWVCLLLRYLPN